MRGHEHLFLSFTCNFDIFFSLQKVRMISHLQIELKFVDMLLFLRFVLLILCEILISVMNNWFLDDETAKCLLKIIYIICNVWLNNSHLSEVCHETCPGKPLVFESEDLKAFTNNFDEANLIGPAQFGKL